MIKSPSDFDALPVDHPEIRTPKIGVILGNLGTPDATDYWSMRRYLSQFLSDKRVVDYSAWLWQPLLQAIILTKRPFSSGAAYRSIWNNDLNESPLRTITRDQTTALAKMISKKYGNQVIVDFAMRYGNPSMDSVITRLKDKGATRILFFPLYPQYAGPTTATANDEVFRVLMKMKWQPSIRTAPPYYDHPKYIEALANTIRETYAQLDKSPQVLVCSYHGMPIRYLHEGDPYHCQCQKTTRLLQQALGWEKDHIITTFQSKFGPEEWLQPYTVEKVAQLAKDGKNNIAIISPAFSADCVETLEEINEEIKESFEEAGGKDFTYIPCLNDRSDHIEMMMAIVACELGGWVS